MSETHLSNELLDQLIFAMENQKDEFFFHMDRCEIVSAQLLSEEERRQEIYVAVPRWGSADGFHLMERFIAGINNPIYRQELGQALSGGKGVFRRFKDVLKRHDPLERLWYNFKEREMRNCVRQWFEQHREALQLESLGPEPEETEDLVLSDFPLDFSELSRERIDSSLEALVYSAVEECWSADGENGGRSTAWLERESDRVIDCIDACDEGFCVRAESPGGEAAALAYLCCFRGSDASLMGEVPLLFVYPPFRGLGLAKLLIDTLIGRFDELSLSELKIDLPGGSRVLSRFLEEAHFKEQASSFIFWS